MKHKDHLTKTTGKQAHGAMTKSAPSFGKGDLAQGHRKLAPAPASPPTPTAHERLSHLF